MQNKSNQYIFISSTWEDLQPERKAVESVLQQLQDTRFIGMEYFGSNPKTPEKASLERVEKSDVYIGIFGYRYGSGITEKEYRKARELNLPCLIYFKEESTIPKNNNKEVNSKIKLQTLRGELSRNHIISTFKSPEDLATKVALDLPALLESENLTLRSDIKRLKEYTAQKLLSLAQHSYFSIDGEKVKINRTFMPSLCNAAQKESLVVTGLPGAGKSVALYELSEFLKQTNKDVVFLSVSDIAAQSSGELRQELNLQSNLAEILKNWGGKEEGFLIIDAFDKALSSRTEAVLRELIEQVANQNRRWKVIASIRKYDLRHNPELKQLFSGNPPFLAYIDPDPAYLNLKHFEIPLLSDVEIEQVAEKSSQLKNFFGAAGKPLRDLLSVPFNLWLMLELLKGEVTLTTINPIQTQITLLETYWERQIEIRGKTLHRKLLTWIVRKMVDSRKLQVDRTLIEEEITENELEELLSANLLTGSKHSNQGKIDESTLEFSHHILFDYAIARLLLGGDKNNFFNFLKDYQDLLIAVRPSLVLHFQRIWNQDKNHKSFWDFVLVVASHKDIPKIVKIIGPGVSTDVAHVSSDFEPIFLFLVSQDKTTKETIEQTLNYIFESLLAKDLEKIVTSGDSVWFELMSRTSEIKSARLNLRISGLLSLLCKFDNKFTSEQLDEAGKTARNLLQFVQDYDNPPYGLILNSIELVCITYSSDIDKSKELLRFFLEPLRITAHGYNELPIIAGQITAIIQNDPGFAEEIYKAVFGFDEVSEEKTVLSTALIGFSSNRRQDFQMGNWLLANAFPQFLERAPYNALNSLIVMIDGYINSEHSSSKRDAETFEFLEQKAEIVPDNSAIWNWGFESMDSNDPLKMLTIFDNYLIKQANTAAVENNLLQFLRYFGRTNKYAVLWKHLLVSGTEAADTLGSSIRSLAWTPAILTCLDTSYTAGEFIKVIFPKLSKEDREKIENAILTVPEHFSNDQVELAHHNRNRLIGCLTKEALASGEMKQLYATLIVENTIFPNTPPFSFNSYTRSIEMDDILTEQGVPLDDPYNKEIRELLDPVEKFCKKYSQTFPQGQEITEILPSLLILNEKIDALHTKVHPALREQAWLSLIEACERIAAFDELNCQKEDGNFIKTILLKAKDDHLPVYNQQSAENFEKHPSWGPAPRISAAAGLTWLAYKENCAQPEVLDAIKELSADPVPAVRFQVALHLFGLYETAPELMWQIYEDLVTNEPNKGVLGFTAESLSRLGKLYPDRVVTLEKTIFERATEGDGVRTIRDVCLVLFVGLYISRNHPECQKILFDIASNPLDYPDDITKIVFSLRDFLNYGSINPINQEQEAIRIRAWALMQEIILTIKRNYDEKKSENLYKLAETIAQHLYFTSGAFDSKSNRPIEKFRPVSLEEKKRFLREVIGSFDVLADMAIPRVTHSIFEAFEYLIEADPDLVFKRIITFVKVAKESNYQNDPMGADLIIRMVERFLAQYPEILLEDGKNILGFIEILDIFVGWPEAKRLIYRMDEIYR